MENIIQIIEKYSLTVRCLPFEVTERRNRGGDGFIEMEPWKPDDNYFKKTYQSDWEVMKKSFYNNFPNGRVFFSKTKTVAKGGWWFVKTTPHTGSRIEFDSKIDFFAPTLEEAIKLFLDSLENNDK